MWGWLDSIVSGLRSVWESISNISGQIVNGLSSFFSTIFDWLSKIFNAIGSIASSIVNGIGNFFGTLFNYFIELLSYLNPFSDNFILKIFFEWITDLLETIFVPDVEQIRSDFNTMLNTTREKLGLNDDTFNSFTGDWNEKPVEDVSSDYNIYGVGTLKLKFLDVSYLTRGIEYFRPAIKGLIVFLLLLYNYRMVLSFIGQDPGVYAMARDKANESRKEK